MGTKVQIIRSDRKTMALQITREGAAVVRAPRRASQREIEEFVRANEDWIRRNLAKRQEMLRQQGQVQRLSPEELDRLADQAARIIPERVAYYAPLVGVTYGRITIRNQKTKWGSCSSKGNLNFNCLLMLAPPEVLDSVVVHELCHRIEMNHSPRFYAQVYRVFPDYDRWNRWLKENGAALMRRMTG